MSDFYYNSEKRENIMCPYCGKEYEPSLKETYIGGKLVECYKEGSREFTCDHCKRRFVMSAFCSWEYLTETIEGEMTDDEWEIMNPDIVWWRRK